MIEHECQHFDLESHKENNERVRLRIGKNLRVLEETIKLISIYLQNGLASEPKLEIRIADKIRRDITELESVQADGQQQE